MAKRRPGAGRKRKPTELKLKEGAYVTHPERFDANEPAQSDDEPMLSSNASDIERIKFTELRKILGPMGLWSATYQDAITLYLESWNNYTSAVANVRRYGQVLVSQDKDGQPVVKRNPFAAELHKYKDELVRLMSEFGLTPSSKSRISLGELPSAGLKISEISQYLA